MTRSKCARSSLQALPQNAWNERCYWEREHGLPKQVALVSQILETVGWREQVAAASTGDPADAPSLNEDAAMMLVDQVLIGEEGSQRPCTREQIRLAFAYLTSPVVGRAVWANVDRSAVVITRPARSTRSS